MRAKFVLESLRQREDSYDDNSETIQEEPILEPTDLDDEDDELFIKNDIETSLENELKSPEYARREVSFKVKGQPGVIEAVPMAKMRDGSFLMKVDGKFKKFKMSDIIEESFNK